MDPYQILLQSIQTLLRAAEDQLTDRRAAWQIDITISRAILLAWLKAPKENTVMTDLLSRI